MIGKCRRLQISSRRQGTSEATVIRPQAAKRRYVRFTRVLYPSDFEAGEKARISAAGGFVDFGRVNGNLALSRAIGDFEFKKSADLSPEQQIVTAFPDVIAHDVSDDDEFLVIACDGEYSKQAPAFI